MREAFVSQHHGLLGTVIEIIIDAEDEERARRIEGAVIDGIGSLQGVFDVHRPDSEICRWRRGASGAGGDLSEVLGLALRWMEASGGAFNPAVGALKQEWMSAAESDRLPSAVRLAALAAEIRAAPYRVEDGLVTPRSGRIADVDLNAIAKGWIVDRAVDTGFEAGAFGITVNAGGDIVHRSSREMTVGIEDPRRPHDNVPPMRWIRLENQAVATSGGVRRFWTISGRRYPQVLDPRTGWPIDHILSASVVAGDAASADAAATVLTVMPPEEGLAWATGRRLAAFVVPAEGPPASTPTWSDLER